MVIPLLANQGLTPMLTCINHLTDSLGINPLNSLLPVRSHLSKNKNRLVGPMGETSHIYNGDILI